MLMNRVPEADTELNAITRNQLIKQAVMDYSRDRPDTITTDVTGDGGKYYPISNLTDYADSFSRITRIEYPAPTVASDETPVYLEAADWDEDYYASGTRYLWLPNHAPAATETVRITYTAPYIWSAATTTTNVSQTSHGFSADDYIYQNSSSTWVDADPGGATANLNATHQATTITDTDNFVATILGVSVPEIDFFAICDKAACLVCQAIAERFSRTTDSTISADSVGHTTRAQEFANRAREFCQAYNEHLGIMTSDGGESQLGQSEFIDFDTSPLYPVGREFLFHNRGSR